MRIGSLIAFCALLALLSGGCLSSSSGVAGAAAPAFEVESIATGRSATLSGYRGKVVLLEFWATWCGPCHQFAPFVERLHRQYGPKGLEVVSVSDEPRSTLEDFAAKRDHTYPIFRDPDGAAHRAYGVEAIPTVVVIGRDGKKVYAPSQIEDHALEEAIKAALAVKPS